MENQKATQVHSDYQFHTRLIHAFVDGVTQQESLLQLPFEHNCLNWILGHIVTNRSHVLETVGAAHPWADEVRALYHTDTPPVTPGSKSLKVEVLVNYLDESVSLLETALGAMGEEQFEEPHSNYRGEKTRHAHLTGFHWHETFHLGQLEILRAFVEAQR